MARPSYSGATKHVVVLGGGFGGAYAAQTLCKRLCKDDWQITLVDQNNFLLFYPLLIEAGVGSLEPRHVVVPLRKFISREAEFKMAAVHCIDLQRQKVRVQVVGSDHDETLHYDHLVLALGSVTKLPDIPGLKEHGFELKSLADSVEFRDRGIRLLEYANTVRDKELRRAILRVVVVGANFTGIELAGEYQHFLTDTAKEYPNIDADDIEVYVIEYGDRILSAIDEELADFARKHLESRGLKIRTKTTLTEIHPHWVKLTTGETVPTYTTAWCAGVTPNPLVHQVEGLPLDEKGYVLTEKTLQVKGFDNVWAVGDCADTRDQNGKPYASTAQNATRQGILAAKNILSAIEGQPLSEFNYNPMGSLAALGCRNAVAKVMGVKLAGFPAWFLYRTVYMLKMPSWSRRFRIVMDWTLDLLFHRDAVQLGVRRPAMGATQIEREGKPSGHAIENQRERSSLSRSRSKSPDPEASRNLR